MFKKTLLVAALAGFTSTAALAGSDAGTPQMTAQQIETISTQDSSDGIILPIFLMMLIAIAVGGN